MQQSKCPNCGAGYNPQTIGRLQDKVLHCSYCGQTIDIPDAYEITREEVIHDGPGTVRKVTITERRSDGSTDAFPFPEAFKDGSFNPQAVFEKLKEEGRIPLDAEFTPDENGNFEYRTSTENFTTHTTETMGETVGKLQEMMGDGFDPFGRHAGSIPSAGPGKNFSRTVTRERKSTSMPEIKAQILAGKTNADPTALVKWLAVLAGIVLLIVLAVKLL